MGLRTLLILLIVIYVNHFLSDYLISEFHIQKRIEEILDSFMIIILTFPFLYLFVVIPFRNNAINLKDAIDNFLIAVDKADKCAYDFRSIVESNSTAMAIIEPDQTISFVNDEYCFICGYKKDEIIGESWEKLISPKDLDRLLDYNRRRNINPNDAPTKYEYSFVHKDGNERQGLMSVSLISNKRLIVSSIDITERKKIEAKLRNERDLGIDILENMSDAFVSLDRNWCYTYMNEKAGKIAARDPKEMIGVNIWSEHPEAIGLPFQLNYERAMYEKVFIRMEEYYPPSGTWFENRINPTEDGIAIFYNDITERKNIELALIQAKERAEESDRLKSAFLANMSHEIRTPMNGILGFANLLKEPRLSSKEREEYLSMIGKSGKRMLNIINDIVDISKIEAGQMGVNITDSNINEQIEYIYTFFKPEAGQKGIQLLYKNTLSPKDSVINTDREKVFAILTNLVKNALKYSNSGSIEFGYVLCGDYLEFFVKDEGIGVPAEMQESIFERFIQADLADKRAFQGAGLGLTISKRYVEMLGGKIWMKNNPGKGSTFYFTLPYITATKEKIKDMTNSISEIENKMNKNLKILIAEDDDPSEMLISMMIKKMGKELLKVKTGTEAIEVFRNNQDIDLILMDIQMPEMSGYDATRKIREFNKEVIIIAQTAYGLSGDRERAIEAGCNDYIAKPIDRDELLELILKYLSVKIV